MRGYVRFLLKWRYYVLAILLVSMGISAFAARKIQVRFQYRDLYTYDGNRMLEAYESYHRDFGDPGGNVVVYVRAADVFTPDVLQYIDKVSNAIAPHSAEFSRVRSLTRVNAIRGEQGEVVTGTLLRTIPRSKEEFAVIRKTALENPLIARRLVSADSRAAAVLAEMRTPAENASIEQQRQALDVVEAIVKSNPPPVGVTAVVTGAPLVEVATTHALMTDQLVLIPGVIAVVMLALFIIFRSAQGVVMPMASVTIALAWTAGLFEQIGRPIDIIGSIIPITLLTYGVVDPIFVLTRYLLRREQGLEREDAILAAVEELAIPCLLTSLTTAVGFAAFITATLPTIKSYGLTVAVGVLLVWVSTVTLLPILLVIFPEPKAHSVGLRTTRWAQSVARRLWGFVSPRALGVVALSSVGLVAVAGYARTQQVSNEYVGSLPRGSVQNTVRSLEKELTGVVRLVVYIEGPRESLTRPEVLKAVARVDHFLEAQPLVTSSVSIADMVEVANRAFNDGDPAALSVPNSKHLIAQYLALLDPEDRAEVVTQDYSRSMIAALMIDRGSATMALLKSQLQREIDEAFQGLGVTVTLTGNGVVAWTAMDTVVEEMVVGFVGAFVIVMVIVLAALRSVRLAVVAALPNLIPAAACFATIRLMGVYLRLDTAIVLCIAMGALFNTTIQLTVRAHERLKAGVPRETAIGEALGDVGPPALFSTAILSAGFSVLYWSSFPGMQALGLLTVVTILFAFIADMIVTPALSKYLLHAKVMRKVEPSLAGRATADASGGRPTSFGAEP